MCLICHQRRHLGISFSACALGQMLWGHVTGAATLDNLAAPCPPSIRTGKPWRHPRERPVRGDPVPDAAPCVGLQATILMKTPLSQCHGLYHPLLEPFGANGIADRTGWGPGGGCGMDTGVAATRRGWGWGSRGLDGTGGRVNLHAEHAAHAARDRSQGMCAGVNTKQSWETG